MQAAKAVRLAVQSEIIVRGRILLSLRDSVSFACRHDLNYVSAGVAADLVINDIRLFARDSLNEREKIRVLHLARGLVFHADLSFHRRPFDRPPRALRQQRHHAKPSRHRQRA